jgi:hypothetical protein
MLGAEWNDWLYAPICLFETLLFLQTTREILIFFEQFSSSLVFHSSSHP